MEFPFLTIFKNKRLHRRIHLDYAATTPVRGSVLKAMQPYWKTFWANPSAIYKEGVIARKAIEDAREKLARTLRVRSTGITFTSGGTESNNLALIGLVREMLKQGKNYSDIEIITTRVEHPSIQETVEYLSSLGVQITYMQIDEEGLINLKNFESLLSNKTALVTFAYVNSETGVIQDVKKISRILYHWNEKQHAKVYLHLDACQAPLWLSCALDSLGVDMMSLDAGKCYGPKSIGVLVRKHGIALQPVIFGGGQESGLRSGTENTALIIGCVEAIVCGQTHYESRSKHIEAVRDGGFSLIKKEIPTALINGSRKSRIANNINISIPGLDTEYAVVVLDKEGIAASTRSACGSSKSSGSQVVREMTGDNERANTTVRFTLGEETREEDIARAIVVLKNHIARMSNALKKS